MSLIPLGAYNAKRLAVWEAWQNRWPRPNGIECPKCGAEMEDCSQHILSLDPPQKEIQCPKCHRLDYRLT